MVEAVSEEPHADQGARPDGRARGEPRGRPGEPLSGGDGRRAAKKPKRSTAKKSPSRSKSCPVQVAIAKQGQSRQVDVDGRQLALTNLDKVLWPEVGFTKGEMIDYYARIADAILPHLARAPADAQVRYPNGVAEKHFYEKRCPKHRPTGSRRRRSGAGATRARSTTACATTARRSSGWPSWPRSSSIRRSRARRRSSGPRSWPSTSTRARRRPSSSAARVALRLRELFGDLGLESFPKTSGSKGIQVYVPLNTKITYDQTKPFARAVAQLLETPGPGPRRLADGEEPAQGQGARRLEPERRAQDDGLRLLATGRERPTVSTPVEWEEVERALRREDPDLLRFEAGDVLKRVKKSGDLFAPVVELKQKLPDLEQAVR